MIIWESIFPFLISSGQGLSTQINVEVIESSNSSCNNSIYVTLFLSDQNTLHTLYNHHMNVSQYYSYITGKMEAAMLNPTKL